MARLFADCEKMEACMRILLVAVTLTVFATLPRAWSAEVLPTPRLLEQTAPPIEDQSLDLLRRLSVNLIPRAHAAECTPEGETCSSNEQCCPGLECSGGPPATCSPED
jgi:hypothetical protein